MSQHKDRTPSDPALATDAGTDAAASSPDLGPAGTLPETYGVDEVGVLCKDPWWYFVYWEVTEPGLDAARQQLGASADPARLVLRILSSAGERRGRDAREIRDIPVDMAARHGRKYLEAPRHSSAFRVAIGLLSPEGLFAPIAHSPSVRMPPQQPSSETSIEWLHVLPARSDGKQRERIVSASQPHRERIAPARGPESAAKDQDRLADQVAAELRRGGSSELVRSQATTASRASSPGSAGPPRQREP